MGKSLGLKLRVIDEITDFSCLPFCPHLVSITATQNQGRELQGVGGITETNSTTPEDRGTVLTLSTLPYSPSLNGDGPFL